MVATVAEFLDGKGSAELLVKIDPDGSRRKELAGVVNVAPNTLSKRLREGREAGVIETTAVDDPSETGFVYVLTPKGARVRRELEEKEVGKIISLLETYRNRVDEKTGEVVEWAEDNPGELGDNPTNRRILTYYQSWSQKPDDSSSGE